MSRAQQIDVFFVALLQFVPDLIRQVQEQRIVGAAGHVRSLVLVGNLDGSVGCQSGAVDPLQLGTLAT